MSAKRAAKLRQKKHRESERLFLAEGRSLFEESPVPAYSTFTGQDDVKRISSLETPTGPVGVFAFLDVSAEELLQGRERLVLLHGVQDPGNVGTVIRSAHAFGAGVALSKGCADLYNPKTVRATMGSIFHTPVAREVDGARFVGLAGELGFCAAAAVPGGGESPRTAIQGKTLVVVGSEGSGLPEEVEAACDRRVSLPAQAPSLNAAVAASILLYEAYAVC
ncbi:TrmH family RNA methyltransferase [Rubrobacter aplysinae]|uniref:TrmH family RNA methyltransferase n=1 Tax=Rubrobacter aplysinae TaxID=909625 RepID=UPI00064C0111|nr:RNA methyltransferase [Rubrobacter aplysinae]